MDDFEQLKEKLYDDTLEEELMRLDMRRKNDPDFTLQQAKIMLDNECKCQDSGWCGRGGIQHLEGLAKVSALEIFYHRWKKEEAEKTGK